MQRALEELRLADAKALADAGLRGVIFGHAGDAHAHVNALVDLDDSTWRARCERLLDEVSFQATSLAGQTVRVDAAYVDARLGELSRNEDLSRYIL